MAGMLDNCNIARSYKSASHNSALMVPLPPYQPRRPAALDTAFAANWSELILIVVTVQFDGVYVAEIVGDVVRFTTANRK